MYVYVLMTHTHKPQEIEKCSSPEQISSTLSQQHTHTAHTHTHISLSVSSTHIYRSAIIIQHTAGIILGHLKQSLNIALIAPQMQHTHTHTHTHTHIAHCRHHSGARDNAVLLHEAIPLDECL